MNDATTAAPIRDAVDQIWDMRAELWSGEGYDAIDQVVTDVYAAGRDEERKRLESRITALENALHAHDPYHDLLKDSADD